MINKIAIILLLGILLPSFSLAQGGDQLQLPENMDEVQELGERALEIGKKELPGTIEKVWQEEVLPIWQKMYDIWSNWWDNTIQPWLDDIWQKIMSLLGQEIEKRKPLIEEEFEKEKEELGIEASKIGQSLWERFKELIK